MKWLGIACFTVFCLLALLVGMACIMINRQDEVYELMDEELEKLKHIEAQHEQK